MLLNTNTHKKTQLLKKKLKLVIRNTRNRKEIGELLLNLSLIWCESYHVFVTTIQDVESFLPSNIKKKLMFLDKKKRYIGEAIKVEKKKCDICHTFGFDPPPAPRVWQFTTYFFKASGIIRNNFGQNYFFPLKKSKYLISQNWSSEGCWDPSPPSQRKNFSLHFWTN